MFGGRADKEDDVYDFDINALDAPVRKSAVRPPPTTAASSNAAAAPMDALERAKLMLTKYGSGTTARKPVRAFDEDALSMDDEDSGSFENASPIRAKASLQQTARVSASALVSSRSTDYFDEDYGDEDVAAPLASNVFQLDAEMSSGDEEEAQRRLSIEESSVHEDQRDDVDDDDDGSPKANILAFGDFAAYSGWDAEADAGSVSEGGGAGGMGEESSDVGGEESPPLSRRRDSGDRSAAYEDSFEKDESYRSETQSSAPLAQPSAAEATEAIAIPAALDPVHVPAAVPVHIPVPALVYVPAPERESSPDPSSASLPSRSIVSGPRAATSDGSSRPTEIHAPAQTTAPELAEPPAAPSVALPQPSTAQSQPHPPIQHEPSPPYNQQSAPVYAPSYGQQNAPVYAPPYAQFASPYAYPQSGLPPPQHAAPYAMPFTVPYAMPYAMPFAYPFGFVAPQLMSPYLPYPPPPHAMPPYHQSVYAPAPPPFQPHSFPAPQTAEERFVSKDEHLAVIKELLLELKAAKDDAASSTSRLNEVLRAMDNRESAYRNIRSAEESQRVAVELVREAKELLVEKVSPIAKERLRVVIPGAESNKDRYEARSTSSDGSAAEEAEYKDDFEGSPEKPIQSDPSTFTKESVDKSGSDSLENAFTTSIKHATLSLPRKNYEYHDSAMFERLTESALHDGGSDRISRLLNSIEKTAVDSQDSRRIASMLTSLDARDTYPDSLALSSSALATSQELFRRQLMSLHSRLKNLSGTPAKPEQRDFSYSSSLEDIRGDLASRRVTRASSAKLWEALDRLK